TFCTSIASSAGLISFQNDIAGRYATPLMLVLPFFFATTFTLASMYIWSRGAAPDFLPPPAPEAGSRGAAPGGVVGVPPDSLPPPAPEAGSRGAAPGGVAGVPPDSLPPPAPEGGIPKNLSRRGLRHPLLSLVAQAILFAL